jgi:hypothetical protein
LALLSFSGAGLGTTTLPGNERCASRTLPHAAAARAHKWVSGVFWRTQKEDVAHEISLPRQDMLLPEMLRFAPVEYLVYRRQHQECAQAVKEELASMKMNGLETLDDLAKFCRNKKKKILQEVLTKPLCSS